MKNAYLLKDTWKDRNRDKEKKKNEIDLTPEELQKI